VNPSYTVAAAEAGDTVRIVETASNAGGGSTVPATSDPTVVVLEPSTPTTTTTTPTPIVIKSSPTAAQVKAALEKALVPSGAGAHIKALLKAGGYSSAFGAPSAGKLALDWYQVPKGARLPDARAAKPRPRSVLIASVSATITKAGKFKAKVKLSRAGRTRLRSTRRSLTLTGQGSFTPSGARQTTIRRTFSVRR